jgi:ABC-type multidrug transport system, ATPase and permease components
MENGRNQTDAVLLVRLARYLASHRRHLAVAFCLLLAVSLLQLAGPYLLKIAIDDYIVKGDYGGLGRVAALYTALAAVIFLLQYAGLYVTQLAGQRKMGDFRQDLFARLEEQPLPYFDRQPAGNIVTLIVNDAESLHNILGQGIVAAVVDIVTVIGVMAVLLWLDIRLALVTFALLPPLVYATKQYRDKTCDLYRAIRVSMENLNAFLQENITGMTTVQVFNRETENYRRFATINTRYRDELVRSIGYAAVYFPLTEFLYAAAAGAVLWYGGVASLKGTVQLGTLVAFIQYGQRFFTPVLNLSGKYDMVQHALTSLERIFAFLDASPPAGRPGGVPVTGAIKGEIEFRDVYFSYDSAGPVLRGISFHLAPGGQAAIVGATGAGKTSLINLIGGFYGIQQGTILIDGLDVRTLDKHFLRRQIGIVAQDPFLFDGDIEYNISLGDPRITAGQVEAAARLVNAHDFIARLPRGYRENVGPAGSRLSTGQKQLIAFARALVFAPKILILDEATASIDSETEALIRDAMARIVHGRTTILIAHRLSTVRDIPRIIVLDQGQIAETGSHETLLGEKGIYYDLYRLQNDGK